MTQPATTEQLLILVERAERGRPLTADEAALLRTGVAQLEQLRQRAEQADAVTAETKRLLERRTTTLRERAERAEAELAAEKDISRRLLAQRQELAAERYAWQERGTKAEAAIERVRRIHTRGPLTDACNDCGQPWHCETTRALDEHQESRERRRHRHLPRHGVRRPPRHRQRPPGPSCARRSRPGTPSRPPGRERRPEGRTRPRGRRRVSVTATPGWPPVAIPGQPGWYRHWINGRQVDLPTNESQEHQ